jgi:hypothetical protein
MAEKTKRGTIPAITIDRDFIERLGIICEQEVEQRISDFKALEKRTDEKDRWRLNEPHYSVKYTLHEKNGDVSFETYKELIATNLLPRNVQGLSLSIYHYSKPYVEVYLRVVADPSTFGWMVIPASYQLSSANEGNLLKIDSELRALFSEYKTNYHPFLHYGNMLLIPFLLSLSAGVIAGVIFSRYLGELQLLSLGLGFSVYCMIMSYIKWAYPFYEFNLSNSAGIKRDFRLSIWGIILGVVAGAFFVFL